MPLANSADAVQNRDFQTYKLALFEFKQKINQCLADADWEALPALLSSRQVYLEQISNQPIPDDCRESLKQSLQALLADDAIFLTRVEEQKDGLVKQQLSLDRGFKATQAYKNS